MIRYLALSALVLASAATAAPQAKKPTDPGDKIRCKQETETGSMAPGIKVCKTEREWQDARNGARESSEKLMNPVNSRAPQ